MKENWEIVSLGEITETRNGLWTGKNEPFVKAKVLRMTNFSKDCELNCEGAIELEVEEKQLESRTLERGDLIIEKSGGGPNQPVGRTVLFNEVSEDVYSFSNFTTRLRITNKNRVQPEYLHKYLKYFYLIGETEKYQTNATNLRNLQLNEFKKIPIPIPPLPEQERIVAKLDAAFAAIDQAKANVERNLQNAKELFESVLNAVFGKYVDDSGTKTLDQWSELIVDCEHKTAPTQETGYPSIRTPNIGKGELILDGVYRVSKETYQTWTRRAIPQPYDLIMAREAPAGNVAVVPEGLKPCLGQRTLLIRPFKESVNSYFLAYLLLSPKIQEVLLGHSRGATVAHVNMKDIRNLRVGELPPMEEQKKAVEIGTAAFQHINELQTHYTQKLAELEELKKSLLERAFRGEI
jgi:type I restriction enzyme S subunit